MSKHKKAHFLLTALLIAVLGVSSIGAGIFASRITNDFSASVLTAKKKLKRKKRSAAIKMLQDLAIMPGVSSDPAALCSYAPPENLEYKGEFTLKNTKVVAGQGEEFTVSVYLKNTGNTTWFGDRSGCTNVPFIRLGTARERDRNSVFFNPGEPLWINPNRIAMVEQRVEPGETATFRINSRAPNVSDIFREYFQPVVEGATWLEKPLETAYIDIYVGENDENRVGHAFYLGKTAQASSLDLSGEPIIDIDISEQKMQFKLGDIIVREYTISSGTFNTPTPIGRFSILNKQELRIGNKWPHYRMPWWQGFTSSGAGLHALPYLENDKGIFWNEALSHVGQRVSHGCVRLLDENAEDLYGLTQVGIPVVTHY
ncbi:L,D-transpeptidase family protein [Candidatus Peregrinibacteria bacterium]|nr:L,D-transpeptidase family protein [Candidatus Peregrinibacteria bacterium]